MAKDNDHTDRRLLALLQANARESVATLARTLGIARTTVQDRILRLHKNGTIRGYAVILGRDPFEHYADAVAMIKTSHKKQKSVVESLRMFPEIKACYSLSGDHDLMARIRVTHLEDMLPVIEEIEALTGVEIVKATIILATYFENGGAEDMSGSSRHVAAFIKGEVG